MEYDINISVKNLNETKYLAKILSLKFSPPLFISLREKLGREKLLLQIFC